MYVTINEIRNQEYELSKLKYMGGVWRKEREGKCGVMTQ